MTYRKSLLRCTNAMLLVGILGAAPVVLAQGAPNPQAEALNEEGKNLYKNKDFQGAAAKFREAIALSPDARFYFNLCATLEKAGDYDGALEACDAVYTGNPTDELKGKTGQRAAAIRQAKRERDAAGGGGTPPGGGNPPGGGGEPPPGGGGTPPGGGGLPPPGGGGPQPPDGGGVTAPAPEPEYRWAFGFAGGSMNGRVGIDLGGFDVDPELATGGGVHIFADRLFMPKSRVGLRLYIDVGSMRGDGSSPNGDIELSQTVFELGGGLYKHFKLTKSISITPFAGVHLAGWSFDDDSETFESESIGTFGVRAQATIDLALLGGKHVLSAGPAFQYYLPSETESSNAPGLTVNFDGGSTVSFLFMYTMRFTTGDIPGFNIVQLE